MIGMKITKEITREHMDIYLTIMVTVEKVGAHVDWDDDIDINYTNSTTEQWEKYFDDGEQRILCNNGKGVCPNCHRLDSIDPLARYCRYCGAKLAQEDGHEVH